LRGRPGFTRPLRAKRGTEIRSPSTFHLQVCPGFTLSLALAGLYEPTSLAARPRPQPCLAAACPIPPPRSSSPGRQVAAGKTPMEAMRALKRRLSDIVYHQMILDHRAAQTGPGGHVGAATDSSAAGFNPSTGASEKSLPGPATHDPTPAPSPPTRSPRRPRRRQPTPDRSRRQAHLA
jgi:hypothetical protein